MLIHNKIYSKKSDLHGYGVFALSDINKGEIVEECPIINIKSSTFDELPRELQEYAFSWMEIDKQTPAIIMGYGGVYNHNDDYNLHYYCDLKKRVMVYRAIKNIKKDEELFVNYTQKYFDYLKIEKITK